MKKLNLGIALGLCCFLAFTGCVKEAIEEVEQHDSVVVISNLDGLNLFGTWTLESRAYNGTSNLAVECCDSLILREDANSHDLRGEFTAIGVGYETNGTFSLDASGSTIAFTDGSSQWLRDLAISGDAMQLNYTEEEREVEELWRKED